MKTGKTSVVVVAAFIALIALSNCNKTPSCPESKTTTEDLTVSSLSKVPYSGYDTLYFLNKQGDTCIVRGTGKKYYYLTETVVGNPDCPDDSRKVQKFKINFLPIQGDLSYSIELVDNTFLNIDVKTYKYLFWLRVKGIGVAAGDPNNPFDLDSISINGKTYFTIDRAYTEMRNNPNQVDNENYQVYYNMEFGILRIISKESNEEYTIVTQ
jgi:hypothetical protein